MASGANHTGQPEEPAPTAIEPSPADDEGTGLFDAASAWDDEDAGQGAGNGWDGTAWTEPDEVAYAPDEDGYYAPGPDDGYADEVYDPGYQPTYPPAPLVGQPLPGGRRHRGRGPWPELVIITALAVIAAAVILALTTGTGGLLGTSTATSVVTTPATAANVTSAPAPTTSSTPAATTTSAPSARTTLPPTALPVSTNVAWESGILKSWLAYQKPSGIVAADVDGFVPGELKFAETVSTQTYWAVAVFQPSPSLTAEASTPTGKAALAEFEGEEYAFSWADGKTWTVLGSVPAGDCPGIWMPKPVLSALSLCGLKPPRMPPGG